MKLLNESWKILQEADKPVKVVFGQKDLTDPSSISLKDTAKKAVEDEEEAEEQAAAEKEMEALKSLYRDTVAKVDEKSSVTDQLSILFDAFVPDRGQADTVLGEMVRAMMRILWRDYNDGDVFYEGYGLETAGPSAAYLMSLSSDDFDVYGDFVKIADDTLKNGMYTDALEIIAEKVVDYIMQYPEEVLKKNTIDSRDFDATILRAYIPKYSFTIEFPEDVQKLIKEDKCTYQDVYDYIDNLLYDDNTFEGYELYASGYDDNTLEVEELTIEGCEALEEWTKNNTLFGEFVEEVEEKYNEED